MRDQLLPAHGVQVRRVNEAVPRGGVGHQVQVVLCQCVSVCVCSVFVLYRFRAVCAHCVCVLVVCSVRAYLHKDIRFTLTDYALCGICGFLRRKYSTVYTSADFTHLTRHRAPPRFLLWLHLCRRASRVGRRRTCRCRLGRATRSSQRTRTRTARRYQVAHTHASQEAATLVAT